MATKRGRRHQSRMCEAWTALQFPMRLRSDATQQLHADRTDHKRSARGAPASWLMSTAFQNDSDFLAVFHLLCFCCNRKSLHPCYLELAAAFGTDWAIHTGFNLPMRTTLGKGDNPAWLLWSVSWAAFSGCCWTEQFYFSGVCPTHQCAPVIPLAFHFLQAA